MRFRILLGVSLLGLASTAPMLQAAPTAAGPISTVVFRGENYAVYTVDPATQDLRLYWADAGGHVLSDFTALQRQVKAEGGELAFAANAGMFDPASKPVGLLLQNGAETFPLNLKDGPGNFYLKPNGVFAINARHHAFVMESSEYPALLPPAIWATQSGPLLVYGGEVNPNFMPDSKNRKVRSGVGVTEQGAVVFALSRQPVTFYEFAQLFRERLHCPNALYLDGYISDFWTSGTPEQEGQHHFGPMVGVWAAPPRESVTAPAAHP